MELRICQQQGISHSHFLGGKPAWSALDRDKAKAFFLLEAEECPNCHTLREDWVDQEGRLRTDPVWVPVIRTDYGCAALRKADEDLTEQQRRSGAFVALALASDEEAES